MTPNSRTSGQIRRQISHTTTRDTTMHRIKIKPVKPPEIRVESVLIAEQPYERQEFGATA